MDTAEIIKELRESTGMIAFPIRPEKGEPVI